MGKLNDNLQKQLKTELKKDAEDCMIIYKKLKEMNSGKVWESDWNVLVRTIFIGKYPYTKAYEPTNIGRTFIKGI